MVVYKQDMPPPGGYAALNFQKVPPKIINVWWKIGAYIGITTIGWIMWHRNRRILTNEKIENRCAILAMLPLFVAEHDRALLKQLKKNRDNEEKLMENYPDWKVGTFLGLPVFLSLKPNEYFKVNAEEYFAHTDPKVFDDLKKITFHV